MNQKFGFMLRSAAVFHLAVGGLLLINGCAQEDPPMPPGIYVPRHGNALPGNRQSNEAVSPESTLEPQSATPSQSGTAPESVKTQITPAPAPADQTVKNEPGKEESKALEGTAYKVVKGDSLWKLSRKFKVSLEDLAVFNGLAANARLYIGQTLMIPPAGQTIKAASPKAKKFVPAKKQSKKSIEGKKVAKGKKAAKKSSVKRASMPLPADGIYTVKSGDNFTVIARRFGLRVSDVQNANPGVNSSKLKIGQKLQLPAAGSAAVVRNAEDSKPVVAEKTSAAEKTADEGVKKDQTDKNPDNANMEKLLDEVKTPARSETGVQEAASPAANTGAASVQNDENIVVKLDDGSDAVRLGKDMTLADFCKMYAVQRDDIIRLNPTLPFDENLKKGHLIKMP